MDYIDSTFGKSGLDLLGNTPAVRSGLQRICDSIFSDKNALPASVREMILMGIHAARGNAEAVALHERRARDAGATTAEINEILTTVMLSRGLGGYALGAKLLSSAELPAAAQPSAAVAPQGLEEILAYFRQVFGEIPRWVQDLVDTQPEIFLGYYAMRSEVLRDNVLPRKFKELALVALNASERYQDGLIVHTKGALAAGASERELLEAMAIPILTGGMVAWLEAAKTLKVVREEQSAKKAA
jgi:AhpD family alkylhydroperoxidase